MRVAEQQPYLDAVDSDFFPLGFARPERSREWSKRVGDDRLWVHLNFGLAVINPTVGVEYLDLRRRWCDLPGAVYGTCMSLGGQLKPARAYSVSDSPSTIATDLRDVGLAITNRLRDRESVVESLRLPDASAWPTVSYSHRIRLLSILLSASGRLDEASAFARSIASEAAARDQLRPPFDEFVSALAAMKAS